MPQNNDDKFPNSEQGSALWFILIGIVLIGILTAVISRSSSSVNQSGDIEQQSIKISQMLRYANGIQNAVQQLKLRGISESDIDFAVERDSDNAGLEDDNTNCTTTDCRIFNVDGAGLNYQEPPSGLSSSTNWTYVATNDIEGVGTSAPDLILMLRNIDSSVCTLLNRQLDFTIADDSAVDFTDFDGTYTATETLDGAARQEAGCFGYDNSGSTEYVFYHVLLKR